MLGIYTIKLEKVWASFIYFATDSMEFAIKIPLLFVS